MCEYRERHFVLPFATIVSHGEHGRSHGRLSQVPVSHLGWRLITVTCNLENGLNLPALASVSRSVHGFCDRFMASAVFLERSAVEDHV